MDQTHYEGCWKDPKHHACALTEIERLNNIIKILHEASLNIEAKRAELENKLMYAKDKL
jgi:hypothetical protein